MPKPNPTDDERTARMDKVADTVLSLVEWMLAEMTHVRKGRKAPALLLMFDKASPDHVVGYRVGLVDLTPSTPLDDEAKLDALI